MSIMRIGHVDINVMDMVAAVKHYENVLGLKSTMQDKTGKVYMKCWDEWDKYSLVLTPSDRAGVNHVGYKVEKDSDLDQLQSAIEAAGTPTTTVPEGTMPSTGRMLIFNLPSGHEMRLFAMKECVGTDVGSLNPEPWPDGAKGAAAHWLDHVLLMCEFNPGEGINKVAENTQFFVDVLNFFQTEQLTVGPEGAFQLASCQTSTVTPGGTLLLESIAATVIGGVSLFGGRGSIHAALLGALVIGTVQNGLNLMGVENEIRLIVTGLLLVLAVSIDKLIEKATGQQVF